MGKNGLLPLFPCVIMEERCETEFISKGMMKDGVRPVTATLFIVRHYGVIYRLHSLMRA